ncbi:hypothetical protein ACWD5R_15760 [Streptomyces sp. NPDC002514]|uniref:hypothetical protein n=1 Tax=unclassified Streptomyces TaxID=2593676 RepID=UPI00369623AD
MKTRMALALSGAATLLATTLGAPAALAATPGSTAEAAPAHRVAARGCVNADRFPLIVRNTTDAPALVFDQRDCRGSVIGVVPPGQTQVFEFGESVYYN